MARVTVEDCIQHIPNRFELVVMAAHLGKTNFFRFGAYSWIATMTKTR